MGVPFYIVICNEFEHYLQTRLKIPMNVIDIVLFVLGWGGLVGGGYNNVLVFCVFNAMLLNFLTF